SALFRRRGIAPEFGWPDHLTGGVQDDEAVLLSADANGADLVFSFTECGETSLNGLVHRFDPNPGILFHVSVGQTRNQIVVLLRTGQDSTCLEVDDDGFGA